MSTPEAMYGSDHNGLIYGFLFSPGALTQEVDSDVAAAWLAGRFEVASGGFLWLHFSLSNTASDRWLRQHLSLPEAFYEMCHGGISSTRLEQNGDALVGVIHDVIFDFAHDPTDVSTVNLCILPNALISARLRPLRSVDRLRAQVKTGESFQSTVELLAHLLRDQADVLVDIVRRTTQRVDAIEDEVLANRIPVSRRELGGLRRTMVRLQRLIAPEPAALFRLLSRGPAWITNRDYQELRQAAEEFAAAISDSGALIERIKVLQEELAALVNEQTNRTLFVLTIVTVVALPVNMAAGLLGMNVSGIPLSEHPQGFFIVVFCLLVFTMLLAYVALRRFTD